MKKAAIIIVVISIVVLASIVYIYNGSSFAKKSDYILSSGEEILFSTPKKTPHFEDSVPPHSSIFADSPINVVINFNFDLSSASEISVTKDGLEYTEGSTLISENKLSMSRPLKNLADGLYDVSYKACWPDNSCHNGNFQFAVDSEQRKGFIDMRNQNEVAISMENIAFSPAKVIISPGTKVIWTNNEAPVHYVNTDPHPGHNYFPEQNSQAMREGESFSLVFSKPGIYPYHCSAHASVMRAEIIVE